jgi:hypothetical protein
MLDHGGQRATDEAEEDDRVAYRPILPFDPEGMLRLGPTDNYRANTEGGLTPRSRTHAAAPARSAADTESTKAGEASLLASRVLFARNAHVEPGDGCDPNGPRR